MGRNGTVGMRLWFQKHTVEGRLPELDRMYRSHAVEILGPDIEVSFGTLPRETYDAELPEGYVRYGALESLFAGHFAAQAVAAERSGHDAYIIGTSQDSGLAEARSLVGIPVIGYGETAFHVAALTGRRFGVVGFIPELAQPITENIAASGLERWLVGFASLDLSGDAMAAAIRGDDAEFRQSFEAASGRLIERGAEMIIPGEGLPNEVLVRAGVRRVHGAAVLDADGAALMMAEFMVHCRRTGVVPDTEVGYRHRRPPRDAFDALFSLFRPAVDGDRVPD